MCERFWTLPSAVLNEGTHSITAAVTDSGGASGGVTITVTIDSSGEGQLTLNVDAYKIKGDKYAELTWSADAPIRADVYHDGGIIAQGIRGGAYTHGPFKRARAATYQVCAAETSTCSNEATVSW